MNSLMYSALIHDGNSEISRILFSSHIKTIERLFKTISIKLALAVSIKYGRFTIGVIP